MDIPMLDAGSKDFEKELAFNIWSTQSCSDYRNDRERPYNGPPQTDDGVRGKTIVEGLTMRDVSDCFVQGFLAASTDSELQNKTKEIDKEFVGTKYACKNTWRPQDVYKTGDVDPLAVIQNAMCRIEDMMGIYPNIPELKEKRLR